MPTNAVVRARIDEHTKEEASAVLAAMGLTVSDAFRIWTAIPRLTGQLNRVASGVLIVLDPVDGWKGLRVWFGSGCRVMHRRPTARL
ncbi:MAG: hypothetical protein EBW74_08270 [Betaproteobacteria bacterium]|nr:hypothetical protein [Betaproteobacteria bacterium]